MSWPLSLFVALLVAAAALFAAGYVANLAVAWYRISSFEGGSGYFVVGLALLGGVAGGVIGLVAARTVGGFPKALGAGLAVALGLIAVVGAVYRALADVPPELDGERLVLAVEVRWPASQTERPHAPNANEPHLMLGALSGRTQRASSNGPLWLEDARQENGRWIAPAAVDLFTNRGRRSLSVVFDTSIVGGVLIPLKAPTSSDLQWSEWMPRAKPGAPPLPDMMTFRYRVQKASDPLRTERIGGLDVVTRASNFSYYVVGGVARVASHATFEVRKNGQRVSVGPDDAQITELATLVHAPRAALLAQVDYADRSTQECWLVADDGDRARAERLDQCYGLSTVKELTIDAARFERSKGAQFVKGRIERGAFDGERYLFANAVLDVPALAVHRFEIDDDAVNQNALPLSVSPDGRSFARFGNVQGSERPVLVVTDAAASRTYHVAIDPVATRMPKYEHLDPRWASHYFGWVRGASGHDSLVALPNVSPLAYRGRLGEHGEPAYYWLEPAKPALRDTLVEFLVHEMGAERVPQPADAYDVALRVMGSVVRISYGEDGRYVAVFPDHETTAPAAITEIARRFDAALTTGKYDGMFGSW